MVPTSFSAKLAVAFMLIGAGLGVSPAGAQIIAPGQTGRDLPEVPVFRPQPPATGADPSWSLRRGKRTPPAHWERQDGFANPPAYGGRTDARPRSPYLEDQRR